MMELWKELRPECDISKARIMQQRVCGSVCCIVCICLVQFSFEFTIMTHAICGEQC